MTPIADQQGRVALVTGGNSGIGLWTAQKLAAAGARVFIACRSPERAQQAVATIRERTGKTVELLTLDLESLASVRAGAAEFLQKGLPLPLLINNAGIAGSRGLTADGFEVTFGTNHLGHFLFTKLLLPRIVESGDARIVTVSSRAHYGAKRLDFTALRTPCKALTAFPAYQTAKLANVLFSNELARRVPSHVHTYALHPGVVATEVWRGLPRPLAALIKLGMISPEQGAETTLYCATSPEVASHTGRYYDTCQVKEPSQLASDPALARELWERSEAWTSA